MSLGLCYVASDCITQDYCVEESILSIAPICDEICVSAGWSSDGTVELLETINKKIDSKMTINVTKWTYDRAILARKKNESIAGLKTDWVLFLDADEIIHENQLEAIKGLTEAASNSCYNFQMNHYYGLPHWKMNRASGWYQEFNRLHQRNMNLYFKDDGFCVDALTQNNIPVPTSGTRTGIVVHHYGHMRDAKAMALKTSRIEGYYKNSPKTMDGSFIPASFMYNIPEVDPQTAFRTLDAVENGTHPKLAIDWFTQKSRYIKYISDNSSENITNTGFIKSFHENK